MTTSAQELFHNSLIPSLDLGIQQPELLRQVDGRKIARELEADSLSNVTQIVMSELSLDTLPIQDAYQETVNSYPREGIYPKLDGQVFSKRLAALLVARDLHLPRVLKQLTTPTDPESLIRVLSQREIAFSKIDKNITLDSALFAWLAKTVIDNIEDDAFPIQSGNHKESGLKLIASLQDRGIDIGALFSGNHRFYTRKIIIKGPADPYPNFTNSQEETWVHIARGQGLPFVKIDVPSSKSNPPVYGQIDLPNDKTGQLSEFFFNFSTPDDRFSILHSNLNPRIGSFEALELEGRAKEYMRRMSSPYDRD